MRAFRMLARAALLTGLVSMHVSLAPGGATAKSSDGYAEDGARLAAEFGISKAEGAERLRLQDAVAELEPVAAAQWPSTFGGLWIDHRNGGVVHVAFTDGAEANVAALGARFTRPDLLRAETVRWSLASLLDAQRAVVADRDRASAGAEVLPDAGSRYEVWVDVTRNAVVLRSAAVTSRLVAAVTERYGSAVVVEHGLVAEPLCTREACGPTLRSGLRIRNDGGWGCTTAFAARRWSTEWAMLTAAHCDHGPVTGQWARHNNTYYGYTEAERYAGNLDAEFQRVVYNGHNAAPVIWIDGETAREVRAKGTYDGLAVGSWACKSGATSGVSCGSVTSKWGAPSYVPGGGAHDFIVADFCSEPGDSGSGVYSAHKALGILSGGSTATCATSDWTYFSHVEFAEQQLGVSVVTTVAAPEFLAVDAYFGGNEAIAFFSDDLDCSTVTASDFTAKLRGDATVTGAALDGVVLTVDSAECSFGYDSGIHLRLSLNGVPVVLVSPARVSITLTGIVTNRWGGEAFRPRTRTATVTQKH